MGSRRTNLQERYELGEVLGRGGMGVVYKAVDNLMKREVALKTILDIDQPASADLFYKEWSVLATMVHPNIVGLYDIGEFEEGGMKKPFFVMPLLPGLTLDKLIRAASPRLTVENAINIVDQAARGLHAAHERGLVHRDIKPSNIFVMDDDSVKIIDFGIARTVSVQSKTSIKGTLFYMAPECLEMKPPTPLSDQFALAVVAYETLTRRRPFDEPSDTDLVEAIRRQNPPPVSQLNPAVNYAVSQVIHKALAKQPYHRFPSAREFGDALQKARRNEPLEYFDASKVRPRLEKARLSFEQGDYAFALEILAELETEGHLDQEVGLLRRQVDQAVRRTRIKQSLENARRFFDADEYSLALRKVQDALDLDAEDPDALALKQQIERERREKKIEEWIQIASQHLENQAFGQAREALDNVLKLKPNDTVALELVAEAARREREISHAREEKARLYQAAMQAWDKGDITSALSKLEHLIRLDRDQPEAESGRTGTYHSFYNQVHSEHNAIRNAYDEARRNLAADECEAALAICRQYLAKYPNHALFQALQFDVEDRRRQALSAVIAETDRRVEEEPDLQRRVGILEEALRLCPGEPHFERAVKLARDKRDLVNSIISKARYFEERSQFNEALDQWQILRSIHERHPGLAFEIERLRNRRDQQARENTKTAWVEQTDRQLEAGDYDRAVRSVESALAEFPGEPDLLELGNVARRMQARGGEASRLLARARELSESDAVEASLEPLRQAAELDPRNSVIRTVLVNSLLEDSRRRMQNSDWGAAEARLKELLSVDPSHAGAQSLASQIADHKREEFVSLCLAQARRLQAEGEIGRALAAVSQGLEAYPKEPRFEQLQATLQRALKPAEPPAAVGPAADLPITVTSTVVPTTAPAAAPMPERAAAAPKRRPPWLPYAAAGAAAVLLVGIAVGVTILRQHAPPPKPVTAHKSAPPSAPLAAAAPLPAAQPTPAEAPAENAAAPEPSSAARAMGTLRIETGEDGVAVYLNGEKYRRATTRGRLSLSLPPKPYAVHLEKPGLWAADQAVDLRGGDEARLAFHLVPAKASLEIRNAPPGAEVWLDGAQAGSVGPGGAFSTANIEPGSHTVALKKDRFKPSRAEYVFDHGATVTVDGALQSAVGNLKIEVSPAGIQGLQVRLSREGDAQDRPVGETELSLMEGTYQVTASAPQYSAAGATVRVVAGRDAAAALVLKRIPSAPQPKQAFTMEDWVKSEAPVPSLSRWTREEKVWVRRGGDFVLAPVKPAAGTYLFTAIVMKGKRLEWVLNFRDDKNYDLFQMDDKELARTWFVNGKKTGSLKIPHPAKAGDYVSVMIAVTAGSVVHSIFAQQQWRVIDKSERSGLLGRFGFHIPGKDQIGVSDFRFMPQ